MLAANIDTVFVMHSVSAPPNLRRIERELAAAWESGAAPVVVLTKADLCRRDAGRRPRRPSRASPSASTCTSRAPCATTASTALREYGSGHRTIALIGPSGVGKSTLVNALIGEERQADA